MRLCAFVWPFKRKDRFMTNTTITGLPPITLGESDFERLTALSTAASDNFPAVAEFLVREVSRARVLPDAELADGVVRMGSLVAFADGVTGETREAILVYPEHADVSVGKVSILTPIGAALIGLAAGQSIKFQTPAGGWRSLSVLAVHNP